MPKRGIGQLSRTVRPVQDEALGAHGKHVSREERRLEGTC